MDLSYSAQTAEEKRNTPESSAARRRRKAFFTWSISTAGGIGDLNP
jgi:hypothetical protein